MEPFESQSHSFIIKIWCETTGKLRPGRIWRGHITHVPSNERRYLKNLHDITVFIIPYLQTMGVSLTIWMRMKQWMRRQKSRLMRQK